MINFFRVIFALANKYLSKQANPDFLEPRYCHKDVPRFTMKTFQSKFRDLTTLKIIQSLVNCKIASKTYFRGFPGINFLTFL